MKPKKYVGFSGHYSYNIAIAVLNKEQNIKGHEPACVYWNNEFTDDAVDDLPTLKVVVWQTGVNKTTTVLQATHVDYDECQYFLKSKNAVQFLTYDKLCLKLKDLTVIPIVGSGVYVFDKSKNEWFLIGITSEITSSNSHIYISYVKLSTHMNWIANSAFLYI